MNISTLQFTANAPVIIPVSAVSFLFHLIVLMEAVCAF